MGEVVQMFEPIYCANCRESHRQWFEDVNQPDVFICKRCYYERPRHVEVRPVIEEIDDDRHELNWQCPRCGEDNGISFRGDGSEENARYFKHLVEKGEYDPLCPECTADEKGGR
jgi:hypothetical protein